MSTSASFSDVRGMSSRRPHFSSDTQEQTIQDKIQSGQMVLQRIRLKVAGIMLFLVLIVGTLAEITYRWWASTSGSHHICHLAIKNQVATGLIAFLWYGRIVLLGFMPLAGDLRITHLALVIDLIVLALGNIQNLRILFDNTGDDPWPNTLRTWSILAKDFIFAIGVVRAFLNTSAVRVQAIMWTTISVWAAVAIAMGLWLTVATSLYCENAVPRCFFMPAQICVLAISLRPRLIERVQARLNRLVQRNLAQQRAAAGVAGLVGSCSAVEAFRQAKRRFRSIELTQLDSDDIADNTPKPELFLRTNPQRLHGCDAFVSHSWHDSSQAKWAAMQQWRCDFVVKTGREPTIWFDKCCIDQSNIVADLQCLPIFLSSCRRMVVFCGPTYLTRLWCIIELFTFVHIGRDVSHIVFEPVVRKGHEDEDLRLMEDAFDSFNAEDCSCYLEEDKDRMLSVIRCAFGDIAEFNAAVRTIFKEAGWKKRLHHQRTLEQLPDVTDEATHIDSLDSNASADVSAADLNPICETV